MTTPIWKAGTLYSPGALVQPTKAQPVGNTQPQNPAFDTGDLTGWTTPDPAIWSVETADPYSGVYSAKAIGGGVSYLQSTTHLPVAAGQTLTAITMCKLTNNGTDDLGAQVGIDWFDASNAQIGSTSLGNLIYGKGGFWTQSSVTAAAPKNAAYALVRLGVNTGTHGGHVNFDSVRVTSAYQAAPPGLIFKAVQASPGRSAATEPTWPTVNGVTVVDNEVTWEAIVLTRLVWQASPILKSGTTEPTWPTDVGAFVADNTINWKAFSRRVEDVNCPQSKVVAILSSKVFAADKDIVRFSATVNPLDWTTSQDAGYLPTGLQQANSNDMAVLAPYRSNLTAFNASSFQNWQVDPDPAAMALLDQMEGIGSTWPRAAQPVGNDLFYLSQLGVRSVGIAAGTDNLAADNVGMPVDVLVQESLSLLNDGMMPRSTYYPSAGQYWLSFQHLTLQVTGNIMDGAIGDEANGTYRVVGAVRGYTVTVAAGSLPTGITLLVTGAYSGTYTTAGTYTWTVRVTDGAGRFVELAQSVTVNPGIVIGLLHFDTDMTTDATGRTWTVNSWTEQIGYDPKLTWPQWDGSTYAFGPGSFRMSRAGTAQSAEQGFYYGQSRMYSALGTSGAIDGTTDFCVEGFVRRDPGDDNGGGNTMFLDFGIQLWARQSNTTPRKVTLEKATAGMVVTYTEVDRTIPTDRFIHFALVRAGSTITLWWGGQMAATVSNAQLLTLASTFYVCLGTSQNSYNAYQMPGWLDDIRITKGWARYTQPFTPPSGPVGSGTTPAVTIDQSTADVYVYTLNGGKGKWSRYLFPWSVDAFAQLGNDLYIRHGDEVSIVDPSIYTDDVAGVATPFACTVQWHYLDCGSAGVTKMMDSIDIVGDGQGPGLSIGYDQRDLTAFTTPYLVDPDTLTGSPIPIPVSAPSFSVKLDFAGGAYWKVNAVNLHLADMPGQP